jgi:signal transduction histidine kinase
MKKTLYLKFILAYLLFAVFGFFVVASFISNMTLDQRKQEKAEDLYREATLIANSYASELYNSEVSLESVQKQLNAISAYVNSDIWILNPSGRMVIDSRTVPDPEKEVYVEGFNPAVTGKSYYTVGTFFGQYDAARLSVLAPITSNYKIRGYVCIHYPYSLIQTSATSLLNISYLELIVLFVLSLIILIFFTQIVYVPLRRITTATEQYAAGNMHYRFTVESDDEMGYLAATLSYMASEIARQEDDQKKFVANVSHDFRSPLTSIKGFLEAMIDGTIPAEMHEKYLKVVLNETNRLTKLTNGLLTLNNLNTAGMLLHRTEFDINQTIRTVAASFEQTCRKRKVAIELVLLGESLYVDADADRIQQVLYNLIDNAIKFSHNDAVVRIETTEKHSKIFVSVKDSGIGIPKQDQNQIWERFYKTDLSRGKDKNGTGLGLSIVREIIRAHGENINLISTEGVGSEFIFSLKRSRKNDDLEDD